MHVKQFRYAADNLGYLVYGQRTAVVVDGGAVDKILLFTASKNLKIKYVTNTHKHSDHTSGNISLIKNSGAEFIDPRQLYDLRQIDLEGIKINIYHTPGHTNDSICIYIGDAVFTGDTLFVGKVGGTDFGPNARAEYNSLHNKLLTLPDSTRVFPGHNYGVSPESTIINERKTNPFLLQPDIESFINLKKNWLEYKRIHGIA